MKKIIALLLMFLAACSSQPETHYSWNDINYTGGLVAHGNFKTLEQPAFK